MKRLALVPMVVAAMSVSPGAQSLTATRIVGERLVASVPLAPCGVPFLALFMLSTFDHSGAGGDGPRSVVRGPDGQLRSACAPD